MFLVLRRLLVLHRLGMFAGRVMAIAHGGILACSVLITLCRVFLLFGAIFVPSGIAVADLAMQGDAAKKNVAVTNAEKARIPPSLCLRQERVGAVSGNRVMTSWQEDDVTPMCAGSPARLPARAHQPSLVALPVAVLDGLALVLLLPASPNA